MIALNVAKLCKLRNIKQPLPAMEKAGISRTVAFDMIHGKRKSVQLAHIEIMCKLFNCNLHDLFSWIPDNASEDIPTHPLQLIKENNLPDVASIIQQMTVEEIKAMVKDRDMMKEQ